MTAKQSFQYLQHLATTKKVDKDHAVSAIDMAFLCVSIQSKHFYINAERIGDVLPYSNVNPVGHTVSWFEGLLKIQGEIYGVADISPFLRYSNKISKKGFIIALSQANENIAIVVDEVLGLHHFKKSEKIAEEEYVDIYQTPEKDIRAISFQRLLMSPEFSNISIF